MILAVVLLGAAFDPPAAAAQGPAPLAVIDLTEFGVFPRDGFLQIESFPGGGPWALPHFGIAISSSYVLDKVCSPINGVLRAGGQGAGDLFGVAATPPVGNPAADNFFCDPEADLYGTFVYGRSLDIAFGVRNSFGDEFRIVSAACNSSAVAVEGFHVLTVRAQSRQVFDPVRGQFRVGNVLFCANVLPWFDARGSLNPVTYASCAWFRAFASSPLPIDAPRGPGCPLRP